MSQFTSNSQTMFVRDAADFRRATLEETLQAARQALSQRFRRGRSFASPDLARQYLQLTLGTREHETFCLILLDSRHRLLVYVELFRGTLNGAAVFPREVVKEALRHNAAAVILVHNHPSGDTTPSQADELITRRARDALALVDVRVLDHWIVGAESVMSFAERGLL